MNAVDDENNNTRRIISEVMADVMMVGAAASSSANTTNLEESTNMSTLMQHHEEICRFRGTTENYIIAVAFFIIFLLSVIGNLLVLIVIIKQRAMRSITNIYLMNLAASDMMLSVVCMPPTLVSMVMNCWMFGNYMCKILAYLQPVVVTASAYTLAVIAFERYYAICKPLHSRIWQTRSHAYAMITLVWVIAIVANILMLFMYEQQTYNMNGYTCAPIHPPVYLFAYQVYMTVVLLIIPLVVMTVLYGHVIGSLKSGIKLEIAAVDNPPQPPPAAPPALVSQMSHERKLSLWKQISQKLTFNQDLKASLPTLNSHHRRSDASICAETNQSLRSTHTQKSAIAKQRVIKMLIVVVIIFFCCWTPSYIWWLLLIAGDSFKTLGLSVWNSDINTFITLLTYISSCTNPITYCFLNKKFRNAIYATFGRKKNMRHHFQKVYIPINNAGSLPNNASTDKTIINRSVSSTFIQQHQAVFSEKRRVCEKIRMRKNPHIISRTVHASLMHHNRVDDEQEPII